MCLKLPLGPQSAHNIQGRFSLLPQYPGCPCDVWGYHCHTMYICELKGSSSPQ